MGGWLVLRLVVVVVVYYGVVLYVKVVSRQQAKCSKEQDDCFDKRISDLSMTEKRNRPVLKDRAVFWGYNVEKGKDD